MNPKRLIQVFNNHELGLQERLFRLLVTIGLMDWQWEFLLVLC